MADTFNGAQRPVDLILTAPLASAGACGPRFDASVLAITIRVQDRLAWDATFGLPFRVEP